MYYHAPSAKVRFELFNLAEDLGETKNLAAQNPERTAALAKVLTSELKRHNGQMSIVKATGKPVPMPSEAVMGQRR